MTTDHDIIELADALVRALQDTHWSSWQTTAKFDQELRDLDSALMQRRANERYGYNTCRAEFLRRLLEIKV